MNHKKALSLGLSLLLIGNIPFSVSAADLVPFTGNVQPAIPSNYPAIVQNRSISMKSIEDKMSNILNPEKKEGGNKVNRKVLATDDSGSCGDGVTYTFTASTGELKISGSGSMTDYSYESNPWYSYKDSITSLTIENGVTSIGDQTFHGCNYLTYVTIPSSVTWIGWSAFGNCYKLTSVTIPSSVTYIGSYAFHDCTGLTSVTIPSSVTYIGKNAFGEENVSCILTSVTYKGTSDPGPSSSNVFNFCPLTEVKVPTNYTSDTFCGETAAKCLVFGTCGDNVNWIFDTCTGELTISGSGSMTDYSSSSSLPWYSYKDSITSVTIENGVTSIGERAFHSCSKLTSVTIPEGVTSIGSYAFYFCSGLTSVTIPSSVTSIGRDAFYICSKLTSVTIPSSVTSIGSYAFSGCSGLTGTLTIPSSVTSIGTYAFLGCSKLTSIDVDETNPNYKSIDGILYSKDGTKLIKCPSGKTGEVTIPEGVTSIGIEAFSSCSGLTGTLTIPSSVTSIGRSAFYNCNGLTSVTIPEGVTSIGQNAFSSCSGLTGTLTIPSSVTSIGDYAFLVCSKLTSIDVDETNPNYKSIDGILYSKDGTKLIQCPSGKTGEVTIPEGVTSIGSSAFYNCYGLTSVTIPDSVTYIGESAFQFCSKLTSVTIPSSVTYIGSSAFYSCSKLTSVTYKGTSNPGAYSNIFNSCSQLKAVNVPSDYIGNTFCGRSVIKATKKFTPFIQSVYNRVLYFMKLVNCYILFLI